MGCALITVARAVSPVIATVLLALIVIFGGSFVFFWMQRHLGETSEKSSGQIYEIQKEIEFKVSAESARNESGWLVIVVRNRGDKAVNITTVEVNSEPYKVALYLEPGQISELNTTAKADSEIMKVVLYDRTGRKAGPFVFRIS